MPKCEWCGYEDAEHHGLTQCAHRIREERDHLKEKLVWRDELLFQCGSYIHLHDGHASNSLESCDDVACQKIVRAIANKD